MHNASRVASKRGRWSHRPLAFYLRSSRNIALTKIHFKYFLGIYIHLKKSKKLKSKFRVKPPVLFWHDSFPGPERERGIMHSVYNISRKRAYEIDRFRGELIAFVYRLSRFTLEGYGLHCSSIVWENSHVWYCLFLLLVSYALLISTIAISYAKMFSVVHNVYRNAAITWGSNAQVTRQSYAGQMKFTKQLVVVTCGFLIAWTPYAVMSCLRVLNNIEFENGWYELPALFAKTIYSILSFTSSCNDVFADMSQ